MRYVRPGHNCDIHQRPNSFLIRLDFFLGRLSVILGKRDRCDRDRWHSKFRIAELEFSCDFLNVSVLAEVDLPIWSIPNDSDAKIPFELFFAQVVFGLEMLNEVADCLLFLPGAEDQDIVNIDEN